MYSQILTGRFRRTTIPQLGQFDSVPPLVDGELTPDAEVWEEEAVLIVVDVVNACTTTCWVPV